MDIRSSGLRFRRSPILRVAPSPDSDQSTEKPGDISTLLSMMVIMLITAAALLSGCGGIDRADASVSAPAPAAVPVQTAEAALGPVAATYQAIATLEAEAEAEAVARVDGDIVEVLVEEGDRVVAGQPLAVLDTARARIELKRQEARLNRLETEYARERRLADARLVSSAALESMAYEIQALRAEVRLARLDLDHAVVRAPIDGVVAERHVKTGNRLMRDQPAFRVTDVDRLTATVRLPDASAGLVAVGQPVRLTADARPSETFRARVERVSPIVDADTATVRVTIAVEDTADLNPGMFVRLAIVYDRRDAVVLVPADAIVSEDTARSVFVVENGVAVSRAVEVGASDAGMVEIVRGVDAGQRVVVAGTGALKDGTRVQPARG